MVFQETTTGEREGSGDRLGRRWDWLVSSCEQLPLGEKTNKNKKHVGCALSHAGAPCLSVVNLPALVNVDCC